MRVLFILLLIVIPGIMSAQETAYSYRKGEIQQIVIGFTGYNQYQKIKGNSNRFLLDGRWRHFTADSIVLYRLPCVNTQIQVNIGTALGTKKGDSSCPAYFNYNYKDSTSCVIFLNRSSSLEQ